MRWQDDRAGHPEPSADAARIQGAVGPGGGHDANEGRSHDPDPQAEAVGRGQVPDQRHAYTDDPRGYFRQNCHQFGLKDGDHMRSGRDGWVGVHG